MKGELPSPGRQTGSLLRAWLTMDLFGRSRRSGARGSATLTSTVFSQGLFSWIFASLAFADVAPVPYLAGTFSFASAFTLFGLLGELREGSDPAAERDFLLATPLSRRTLFLSKALHSLLFLSIRAFALSLPPAILACWVADSLWALPVFLLLALPLSLTLCGLVELLLLLAGRLLGPAGALTLSSFLRASILGGSFFGLLLGLRAMHAGPEAFPGGMALLSCLPSYWFASAGAGLLGLPGPELPWLRVLLLPLLTILGLLLLAGLPQGTPRRRTGRKGWLLPRAGKPFLRSPEELGMLAFVMAMLARDRSFRLRALPLLGLPVGMVFLGDRGPSFMALLHNLPLAFLPLLIHALPYSDAWRGAWLLRTAPVELLSLSRQGAALAFGLWLIPVQALLFLLDAWNRGASEALPTTLTALGASWLLLPLLVRPLESPAASLPPEDFAPPRSPGVFLGSGLALIICALLAENGLRPGPYLGLSVALVLAGIWRLRAFHPEQRSSLG